MVLPAEIICARSDYMPTLEWADIRILYFNLPPAQQREFIAYLCSLQDTEGSSKPQAYGLQRENQNIE